MKALQKTCVKCRQTRDISQFYKNKKYYHSWCKDCSNARERKRVQPSSEKLREYRLRHKYEMEPEDYANLLESQNGLCAICKEPVPDMHVDHCHSTGKIRGLLCPPCNQGLGYFKDSIERLESAIAYLRVD